MLLFDAGRGLLQRLYESKVNVTRVTKVFFTHLHNDHIEGLPTLWTTPWFLLGRDKPMEAWEPVGTARMIRGMESMFQFDIEHRVNQFNKREKLLLLVREIKDGEVFNRHGVKVLAFSVSHDDGNPAFGYRIEHNGRSVVLSGDTSHSENVVRAGRGADLIVHNVIAVSDALASAAELRPVLAKLTTPEQAARVFNEAAPRAVFSHVVTSSDLINARVGVDDADGRWEVTAWSNNATDELYTTMGISMSRTAKSRPCSAPLEPSACTCVTTSTTVVNLSANRGNSRPPRANGNVCDSARSAGQYLRAWLSLHLQTSGSATQSCSRRRDTLSTR